MIRNPLKRQGEFGKDQAFRGYPGIVWVRILIIERFIKEVFCLNRDKTPAFGQAVADRGIHHPETVVPGYGDVKG